MTELGDSYAKPLLFLRKVIIVRKKHDIESNREAKVMERDALEGVAIAIRADLRHSWQVLMIIRTGDRRMCNYTEA
jgi:hypothetical protein